MTARLTIKRRDIQTFQDYIDNPPVTWEKAFKYAEKELLNSWNRVGDVVFLPPIEEVFRCFDLTPLNSVKAVIIGQDPYHSIDEGGIPHANGLSFSVRKGQKIPPSLANIFKEIKREYPEETRTFDSGDLTGWAKQGVLLLNATLTVLPHKANSHKRLYDGFVKKIIEVIRKQNPDVVWLLWGAEARSVVGNISGNILASGHPSPLAALSGRGDMFAGCDHFIKTNNILIKSGRQAIDWFDHQS